MSLIVEKFDPTRIATDRLFSCSIDSDPWVIFHGTSGFNAKTIEREGFSYQAGGISSGQIKRVTCIFEKIKWFGASGGGFPVLKPFSLDYDLKDSSKGIIFFAETSRRALLYATRDFAGGEKLRALRIALRDLDLYLTNAEVRERHQNHMKAQFKTLTHLNAHPSMLEATRPMEVDLDWLGEQITNCADVRCLAEKTFQLHDHGVIYALKMTTDDVERLRWHESMGVEATSLVPSSKILAKIVVPSDYEDNLFESTGDEYLRRMNIGLLGALAARQ
jgi:hypothetical protein